MQRLIINGGKRLCGEIKVQGAKNSALPLLAGCLLAEGKTVLRRCPELTDVFAACRILNELGCKCSFRGGRVVTDSADAAGWRISEELMREMRSSIVFLGAVLGRTGKCELSYPGGCELGPRPIDMHLAALKQLGVRMTEEHGRISCSCPRGLKGAVIDLPFPSVGATENVMLAAACASGETLLRNAAREPEIKDLADFLNCCGADIKGAGCSTIRIRGVKKLHGCEYEVMPDRIAAATYMAAAAATGGELGLLGVRCEDVRAVTAVFEEMGAGVYCPEGRIFISCSRPLRAVRVIRTMPYPGFPTDAQAVVMAALATAQGSSMIVENIFESRYCHVDELVRMGADIKVSGRTAVIQGVKKLCGASLRAHDLRGGAALAVAALGAEGTSSVGNVHFIDRGYEQIERVLESVGADIRRR
ncbi:UDP-N-acetylglucosamine 1-carboxyvinyltransferase [Ruminococcus sp.]|uniref:UDP-N-acetylglucosamine 1-carboxyvinyltransferase n=1 Tax=Ruminococcus sp. TaxID=41978 RepID=UPI0025E42B1E|nr:UDP-N-acetylglucosamine 1-carboxyvinyltransferase [Ruminococcus sp.]MBQ8965055.1 UDP-N-acetylglucosamine 1-carboxyvinyltransferase [Ruminococcus sp.]